jgi:hypothetical protein
LRELFDLAEYPQDSDRIQVMHAQGFSLVEFFVRRGGKQTLIRFLKDALANNDWDAALKKHYDFATCDECEKAWRAAAGLEISS